MNASDIPNEPIVPIIPPPVLSPKRSYSLIYTDSVQKSEALVSKYIYPSSNYDEFGVTSLLEIDILSRFKHPYIIQAEKVVVNMENERLKCVALILPLADRTIDNFCKNVTTDMKLPILYKIATALRFLHENGILYLNLSCDNVVIQGNRPFLINFNNILCVDNLNNERRGIPYFSAPEIFTSDLPTKYTEAADVWSFAILTLYLLGDGYNYAQGYQANTPEELLIVINYVFSQTVYLDCLTGIRDKYRNQVAQLLTNTLCLNPQKRYNMKQICEDPLFKEYAFNKWEGKSIPPIEANYSAEHRNVLKILLLWIKELYLDESARLLFLTIDLFNRMGSQYINKSVTELFNLAATSIWLAAKLTIKAPLSLTRFIAVILPIVPEIKESYPGIDNLDQHLKQQILKTELLILEHLNGILNTSYLYNMCTTTTALLFSFREIVMSKDSALYAKSNTTETSKILADLPNSDLRPKENIRIKDIF